MLHGYPAFKAPASRARRDNAPAASRLAPLYHAIGDIEAALRVR